ncbi:putative periplasmic lipoprotein [Acinetobacter shaoyimingii]|uniref:DUF4352 domain-containing protein n=1 Tax=Acinetobacter shaoyimingii TaxID=2715164 RepID=A0A6G8RU96_9GAMM|nr:hypothetical protein [Acinetobacter shaoyimingii]QIO05461.1 hypothetical protein G8E00_05580 [Acinetobacter shaoyimingii]
MKKIFLVVFCAMALTACNKNNEQKLEQTNITESKQDIQVGNKFVIVNELTNKNIKLQAFETNLSKDGKYYYQVEIENVSAQPMNLKAEQIVLVDTNGNENRVQMIDRDLTTPYEPKQSKKGIIAFDDLGQSQPKFLKFKD